MENKHFWGFYFVQEEQNLLKMNNLLWINNQAWAVKRYRIQHSP